MSEKKIENKSNYKEKNKDKKLGEVDKKLTSLISKSKRPQKQKSKWSDYVIFFLLLGITSLLVYSLAVSIIGYINNEVTDIGKNLYKLFISTIFTIVFYYIFTILENKRILKYNQTIKVILFTYISIILILYPYFDLYRITSTNVIISFISGIMFSIIGISVFFNFLKNSQNQVKAKPSSLILFNILFTFAFGAVFEFCQYLVWLITKDSIETIGLILLDMLYIMIGSILSSIVFYISLTKTKQIINNCLIVIKHNDD